MSITKKLKLSITLVITACCTILSTAAIQAQSEKLNEIVATVNSIPITESEVQRRIKFFRLEAADTGTQLVVDDSVRRRAVEEEINLALQRRQSEMIGNEITLDAIEDRLSSLSEQNGITQEEFINQFKPFEIHSGDVMVFLLEALVEESITQRVLIPRIHIREEEIDRYLKANDLNFGENVTAYNLDAIVVRVGEVETSQAQQNLLQLVNQIEIELERGQNFYEIARAAQDFEGVDAGELGWRRAQDMVPELFSAISNRGNRAILGPIQSEGNLIFLMIKDTRTTPGIDLPTVQQFHYAVLTKRANTKSGRKVIVEDLEKLRKSVQSGADFAGLAKLYSHDNRTRKKGGDMGWLSEDNIPFEHLKLLLELKIGEVSEVQEIDRGAYILQLVGVRDANLEDRKRSYVRSLLRNHKLNVERQVNIDQLRASADIEYRVVF